MPVVTLNRSPTDTIQSPTLHEWQLMGIVVPIRQDEWLLPIILTDEFLGAGVDPGTHYQDSLAEYLYLKGLEANGIPTLVQVGGVQAICFIDQIQVDPSDVARWNDDRTFPWSTVTVKVITLDPIGANAGAQ